MVKKILKDKDKMAIQYNKALEWYEKLQRPDGTAFCQVAMGQSFLNLKDYQNAGIHFNMDGKIYFVFDVN